MITLRRILFTMTAALTLAFVPACTKDGQDAAGDVLQKEVRISMADGLQTKTALYQYDTETTDGHPVIWTVGDRIWCYSQSGIYVDYTLKSTDLSGDYSGENSRTHIAYRYGDQWVICYCSGSSIGDYVGARKKDLLVLGGGIPRVQTGKFEDSHVCIVRTHPDEGVFAFENMQAFLRFEVTQFGDNRDGKLLEHYVTRITVESCKDGERMAGDLKLQDNEGWRTTLEDSGNDADNVITVIPESGHFIPSPNGTSPNSYFVAVPARNYSKGIRLNLYTHDGVSEAARGYVEVPTFSISRNQILNCHDLLKYYALYVEGISLEYGDVTEVETQPAGIDIMEGHTGTLISTITPGSATDKALHWESSNPDIVSVNQNGEITGQSGKAGESCIITVRAKDRKASEAATASVKVTVKTDPAIDHGGDDGGYGQEEQGNWN